MCYSLKEGSGADLRVCDKGGPNFWVCLGVAETIVGSLLFYVISVYVHCCFNLLSTTYKGTTKHFSRLRVFSLCNNFQISLFFMCFTNCKPYKWERQIWICSYLNDTFHT